MPKRGDDKLYKISLKSNFQQYYDPSKEQSVNESMVKFKGGSYIKQYLADKRIKKGYKIFVRSNQEGYISDFEIFTAKRTEQEDESMENSFGLGDMVHKMTNGFEGKGYHVYYDIFFYN